MKRFQISKEEYEAIRAAEKATEDKNVSKRLRVLMLLYGTRGRFETAEKVPASRMNEFQSRQYANSRTNEGDLP
jgi:hypothetical protein